MIYTNPYRSYRKEERWEQRYAVPTAGGNWSEKVVYPKSKEQKDNNAKKIRELGYKAISCKKLYPFSTEKNQHNFELISNICYNRIHDICVMGEAEEYEGEADKLEAMKEKADKYFCYPLPVAWVTWEEHCEMKELANMAILHRQEACIKAGRPELVTYC